MKKRTEHRTSNIQHRTARTSQELEIAQVRLAVKKTDAAIERAIQEIVAMQKKQIARRLEIARQEAKS
jgi:hypothetical protein